MRREDGQHELGARRGQEPQQRAEIGPETTTADQDKPLTIVAVLVGELHSDTAAERLPDYRGPAHPELVEQIT